MLLISPAQSGLREDKDKLTLPLYLKEGKILSCKLLSLTYR